MWRVGVGWGGLHEGLQAVQYKDGGGTQQNPGRPHDCKVTLAFISSGRRGNFLQKEKEKKLIKQTERKTLGERKETHTRLTSFIPCKDFLRAWRQKAAFGISPQMRAVSKLPSETQNQCTLFFPTLNCLPRFDFMMH